MTIYISIYACIDSSVDGYGRAQHFKNRKMTMLQEKNYVLSSAFDSCTRKMTTCMVVYLKKYKFG